MAQSSFSPRKTLTGAMNIGGEAYNKTFTLPTSRDTYSNQVISVLPAVDQYTKIEQSNEKYFNEFAEYLKEKFGVLFQGISDENIEGINYKKYLLAVDNYELLLPVYEYMSKYSSNVRKHIYITSPEE
jgi:hypothetical protein